MRCALALLENLNVHRAAVRLLVNLILHGQQRWPKGAMDVGR